MVVSTRDVGEFKFSLKYLALSSGNEASFDGIVKVSLTSETYFQGEMSPVVSVFYDPRIIYDATNSITTILLPKIINSRNNPYTVEFGGVQTLQFITASFDENTQRPEVTVNMRLIKSSDSGNYTCAILTSDSVTQTSTLL